MNWMCLAAGVLAAGGVVFHGLYGFRQVPAKLQAADLPSSVFGDGVQTLWMLRLAWHSFTAVLAVAAAVLIRFGFDDSGSTDGPRTVAVLFAVLVAAWIIGGGSVRRLLHPGLPIMIIATALTALGTI